MSLPEPLTAGNQGCFKTLSTSFCFLNRQPIVRLSLPLPCGTALLATGLLHLLATASLHFLRQLLFARAHALGSRCPLSSLLVVLQLVVLLCSVMVSEALQDCAQSSRTLWSTNPEHPVLSTVLERITDHVHAVCAGHSMFW